MKFKYMKNNSELSNYYYYQNNNSIKLYILFTIILFLYLFVRIHNLEKNIIELKASLNTNVDKIIDENPPIDDDLIGITYPEIFYDRLKNDLINCSFSKVFLDFLHQLQVKLIYLEKEINITKLFTFYNIRTEYLHKRNVSYKDENITELHNIINWDVIHNSNQLKGIASDKYLVCKYAEIKLGENLCEQRLRVYNNVEEINFEELVKEGNAILKITNGCHDSVGINNKYSNSSTYIEYIKNKIKYYFQRDYGLRIPEFFHLYSKKRIIQEKKLTPFSDLYEFKFFIVNRDIKFVMIYFVYKGKIYKNFYTSNYKLENCSEVKEFDIFSMFNKEILDKLKYYAYKLSEDFKNFIRVDLYVFHNKIYLSELTFDSCSGVPFFEKEEIVIKAAENFTKYE